MPEGIATNRLALTLEADGGGSDLAFDATDAIVGGWTGRDRAKLEAHIAELAEMGVARPATTPCFYRVGVNLLTTAEDVQVIGSASSGEVEFLLLNHDGDYLVGLGSDHTDRAVEAYNVTISKQCCMKPIARTVWRHADVRDHWDALVLRSFRTDGDRRVLYQEGAVTAMIDPLDLAARYADEVAPLAPGQLLFGGTLPVIGDIVGTERFEIELEDPVQGRRITHAYRVHELPNVE